MAKVYATPGVYIEEKSAFPNSAVPVATAVPAFIGYTEKAVLNKKDVRNVPIRISSFGEYLLYFGGAPKPKYTLANVRATEPNKVFTLAASGNRYLLFYSIKLFFANGGSDCYIVSIGDYKEAVAKAKFYGVEEVKEGEKVIDTKPIGIDTLKKEPEPTMLVAPDLMVLTDQDECFDVQNYMLTHCGVDMRNRISILDVYKGYEKRTPLDTDVIKVFRIKVSSNLQWGAAYYPWVHTTVTGAEEVDFTNLDDASIGTLVTILTEEVTENKDNKIIKEDRFTAIKTEIDKIQGAYTALKPKDADAAAPAPAPGAEKPADPKDVAKSLHETLLAVSPIYKAIMASIRENINLLPPSAAMAGIYSMVDSQVGVFQSPANISVGSVSRPAVNINNEEQEDLNLPLSGKAINAIRTFPGKGILVWGARTLDGNSQDWRYISVRRTVIFIEQSIKYAAEPYVFAPNVSSTWINIKALIVNFLTNVWKSGALAGTTPEDAFSVDVGLGVTMTPVDILDGIMNITVKIAVTRPAEFIVITFQQKMQQS
jgi:phage tail sheath protein FI